MPRANPLQAAFNAGEIGPRLAARVDFAKYRNAGARVENMIPLPQGGLTRRPGTRYIAAARDHGARPRLLPFEFSTEQAYVLEACDGCFRFFRNKGQIVVDATDATITNGTFDTDITGWSDRSTGGASIGHQTEQVSGADTLANAFLAGPFWGDSTAGRKHAAFLFFNGAAADVASVTIEITGAASPFLAHASVYTDNSGSPGVLVGAISDSVNINGIALFTFTFPTPPTLSASTNYWIVLTDESASGKANLAMCADQGAGFASGFADTITSIGDATNGLNAGWEIKIKVTVAGDEQNGFLALVGASGQTAWAEQSVTTTNTDQEHVLQFRVIGVQGDKIKVRVGRTSEGDQILEDFEVLAGYHAIAFTPDASPFYVQFRNEANKTIIVDDVALLGSGASASVPMQLTTVYGETDLRLLKWAQSADVMYFAHPDHPPHKLERRGNATWSLVEVAFQDGPYLDPNADNTKLLDPSAASGNGITISATGHSPFSAEDVGRVIRLRPSGEWGYAVITEVVSPEQVKADVKRNFTNANSTSGWQLGVWSDGRGYPSSVTFFEQRLVWANTKTQPQSFWMSQSGDLENMRPDSFEGGAVEVQDDDALDFTIAADQVNAIRWMSPGRQLILGTSGGEWSVTSDGPVLTPQDLTVRRESTNGSANILPVRISSIVLFVQRARRKLREFVFSLETDGFRTPDLTILADHISESGIREVVYQQEPDSQVHCLREDGILATLTYRREQDVVGWSRHILGGQFEGGAPVIESMATIPGSAAANSENRDEAWVAVRRTINGITHRSIEVFEAPFEGPNPEGFDLESDFDTAVLAAQRAAFYVDAGLTYDGSPTQTLSGLDHLEGETVTILADGARHPDRIVASGAINLETPASLVHVGLAYRHTFKSLKIEAGAAAGTALGKLKRIHGIALVLLHSLGLRIGPSIDRLEEVPLREVKDAMDTAVPLFSGEQYVSFDGDYQRDARVVVSGDAPLPLTLLAAAPELKTNEQI